MTYRSEVVGSLLRPTYLVEAREKLAAGQLTNAEFKAIEDQAEISDTGGNSGVAL